VSVTLSRERRAELLAYADGTRLIDLAERCAGDGGDLEIIGEPRVGTLPLEVREPVVRERFVLADVLAVTAEVDLGGVRGWAMRLGDDRVAVVAAAICDAEVERQGEYTEEIERICLEAEAVARAEAIREWNELAPTIVQFEELL
jgi:alpha-D-ribose 1-methylphosphonate 5-triphosphate synthase subunit PhnG